jgi:hypothetical protein
MPAPDELTITIGAKDIYDAVQEATREVRALREAHDEERAERATKDADTESRLRSLERWKYALAGTSGSGLVAAVVSLITKRNGG